MHTYKHSTTTNGSYSAKNKQIFSCFISVSSREQQQQKTQSKLPVGEDEVLASRGRPGSSDSQETGLFKTSDWIYHSSAYLGAAKNIPITGQGKGDPTLPW